MQTKYGEQAIFINRPKKNRHYLVQKTPTNHSQPKSHRYLNLRRSQQKETTTKLPESQLFKSQLLHIVSSTKNRIAKEEVSSARHQNVLLNVKQLKKSNLRLDLKNRPQRSYRQLSQVNVASDRIKETHQDSSGGRKIVFPFDSIERQNNQRSNVWKEKNQRYLRNSTSSKKESNQMLNFKPKYRSLNRSSLEIMKPKKNETIKNDFIEGFVKQKKLGKGGFAVVWQALQLKSNKRFAVKEIDALNIYQTHLTQINFSTFFFKDGAPKKKFQSHPGIRSLLTLYSYHISGQKAFIVYEHCTAALGQILFDIYQENDIEKGKPKPQTSYIVTHRPLYNQLRDSCQFLKNLIYQVTQAFALLEEYNMVHSDIKTSNILINISQDKKRYSFKLIDYGSSFYFQNLSQYRLATPEYMPPQMINYLNKKKGQPYCNDILDFTKDYCNISAIDMWGLGCVLLEIIHGVPLWLNTKVRIKAGSEQKVVCGKFATDSRAYIQILQKQLELINNIDDFLIEENYTGVALDGKLRLLIRKMLELNPKSRIRPQEVLQILRQDCEYNYL